MDNDNNLSDVDPVAFANLAASYGCVTNEATVPVVQPDDPYAKDERFTALDEFPAFVPEDENDDILIRGRWLERGGAAFVVSTAGTGKSIHSLQTALCWSAGIPFAGLRPRRKLRVWIFQSEDSATRITIDREDIVAEHSETHPEIDWSKVCKEVKFVRLTGKVGAAWLAEVDELLSESRARGIAPDVIIINPFLAFIGGPISDGQYVTPFLRGGVINREYTTGLQCILEQNHVGALIYHHTPKPPSEKEIDSWLKSTFPEYQGAGSSDITNWGRSFITMMRVPKHPRMVVLTAGKNGGGLGWDETDGARRMYLHWSDGESIDTGARHAWRECTQDEIESIGKSEEAVGKINADSDKLARYLAACASCQSDFYSNDLGKKRYVGMDTVGISEPRFRDAWAFVKANLDRFGLSAYSFKTPRGTICAYVGNGPDARRMASAKAAYMGLSDDVLCYGCNGCKTGVDTFTPQSCGSENASADNGCNGCKSGVNTPVESTGVTGVKTTTPVGGGLNPTPDSCDFNPSMRLTPVNLNADPLF